MTDIKIIFNSGTASQQTITDTSNIYYLDITNSDQTYYQNARLQLSNISGLSIGDTAMILINDSLEFDGYISRQTLLPAGTKLYDLQLIGRTYDLWRFTTDSDATYSKKTTNYIISSMISAYASGISLTGLNLTTKPSLDIK